LRLEKLGQLKKSNYLIGTRTRDLPACSIVPHPTTLPRAPWHQNYFLTSESLIISNTGHAFGAGTRSSFVGCDETVHLVRRPLIDLLHQPQTIDDECGAVGGMRTDRGNRSTRRKLAPTLLCPPQIPYDLTSDRTRAGAVGNRTNSLSYGAA
jgi:hypothetical protein